MGQSASGQEARGMRAATVRGLLGWRGLLASERPRVRMLVFVSILVGSVSMSFLQLGFVSVAPLGIRICYIMGLLGPIAATAILLGTGLATLEGLLSAVAMCVHAWLEPLDIVEKCLVLGVPYVFVVLYALLGFVLALLFGVVIARRPHGAARVLALGAVCLVPSLAASLVFVNSPQMSSYGSRLTSAELGSPVLQVVLDAVLMACVALACDAYVRRWYERRPYMGMRTIMKAYMLSMLSLVYVTALAACFVAITRADRVDAYRTMRSTLAYMRTLAGEGSAREDAVVTRAIRDFPQEQGMLTMVRDRVVSCSNHASVAVGEVPHDRYGAGDATFVEGLAATGSMEQVLYVGATGSQMLAYACAEELPDGTLLLVELPFSLVFDHRRETMAGAAIVALVILVVAYECGSRLLRKVVMGPIDRTNASLERIVHGDLDVLMGETSSVEFASLSAEINETVDALKRWIDEAQRSMESELQAARSIQESALPQSFPAFSHMDAIDLYASMVPAREVGGDFYDYFLLDDHTVGFFVADVSGKGVPAALFMMRAKNEIATCMQASIPLADAMDLANKHLCEGNEALTFVTVWAGVLDLRTLTLTYVNAGHNEPLLLHDGRWEWVRQSDGPIMGFADFAQFGYRTRELEVGDELLLFTDGVTEAMSAQSEQYGEGRLRELVDAHLDLAPHDLDDAIRVDLARWAEGAEQSDDITMLTLRVCGQVR